VVVKLTLSTPRDGLLSQKTKKHVNRDIERIKKYCAVVRVFTATQIEKMNNFRKKKSDLMEI
jgi:hypothetical protein